MRVFLAASVQRFHGIDDLFKDLETLLGGKPVRTQELHLTYRFFGELSGDQVTKLIRNADRTPFRKFDIKITGIGAFPSIKKANVLYLEVENSPTIIENARLAVQLEPDEKDGKPFVPHITVCRFKRPFDCTPVKEKFNSIRFEKEIVKLAIYESILNATGPVYREIKAIQLK